jgi:hypothetical protein
MKTTRRRGSWRNVAPGQYVKNIGTYDDVKFGATARVSFVPFPTCEILDANGVHVAIPTPADAKKFIAAAKKVYAKDTAAASTKAQKRATSRSEPAATLPKWKPKNTPFVTGELLSDISSRESMRVEQKLAAADAARRKKASAIWMSGTEPGTQRDIYLRLYAADEKKYRK